MIKYALNLILRRKLRTFLTSLGILIAVMLMSFILFGMSDLENLIVGQFSSQFRPDELAVSSQNVFGSFSGPISAPSKEEESKETVILNTEIVDELEDIDGVESVYPLLVISGLQLYIEGDDVPYPNAFPMASDIPGGHHIYKELLEGDDTSLDDGEVYVSDFVTSFYDIPNEDILGKKVYLRSDTSNILNQASKSKIDKEYEFTVVGVVDTANDVLFMNLNDGFNTVVDLGGFDSQEEYLEDIGYSQILLGTDLDMTKDIEEYIVDDLGLSVISTETLTNFVSTITGGLTIALVVFGAISAVVASVGIVNTMIMSIYEQTKEIGIIKAIGASNFQVLVIFLIQSAVIGLIGGLLGLGITYALMRVSDPFVVDLLVEQGFDVSNFFNFRLDYSIYITFGSIVIGILAGIYPAYRASKLDPVKALRYE